MGFEGQRVLLTGASSGIGCAVSGRLAAGGARLVLVGRDEHRLKHSLDTAHVVNADAHVVRGDLTRTSEVTRIVREAEAALGGIDVLVNAAGVSAFEPFETQDARAIEESFRVNAVAPLLLAREVLPAMKRRGSGHIVNVGAISGSIGLPYFATYSATKFALRGFSEALRRELNGGGIDVTYIAPRATRTAMSHGTARMAEAVGLQMDDPWWVAGQIVHAIERQAKDRYMGFRERVFVRLNGLLPRLLDGALQRRASRIRPFAEANAPHRVNGS